MPKPFFMREKKFYNNTGLFFDKKHLKQLLSVTFFLIFSLLLVSQNVKAQDQLVFVTQPSATAQSGITFARQPAIQVWDSGAPFATAGIPITASLTTGTGTLVTTLTVNTDLSGTATFPDLALGLPPATTP
jgi:hypothetical protein